MKRFLLYLILIAIAAAFLTPLAWTITTALKTRQQVYAQPMKWIPTTYKARDVDGSEKPVSVVSQIPGFAVTVKLTSGPRTGQIVAVGASALIHRNGLLLVQLSAAPPPSAEIIGEFPAGVAQIRFPGSKSDTYLPANQLKEIVDPQFQNFAHAWTALPLPFHWFVLNTYTITIINIVGQTLSCSLVAYGFARARFPGRNALFLLMLSTMMLPSQVTMIPVFLIWNKLHLVDTFAPLTIPSFFAHSAFSVFLLRQAFMGLPRELDEAAMLDGCGPIRIWWQILLPLMKPALTTVAVLCFIANWDDFLGPLIYLNHLENYTVSLALRLFQDQNGSDFNLLMAAALVHIVPVVLLFFIAQRYFVKGIAATGMKS